MFISKPFHSPLVDSPPFLLWKYPVSLLFLSFSMCTTPLHPLAHALFTQTHMHTHTCSSTSYKKGYEGALLLAHMFTICHHCDGLNTTAGVG